MRQLFSPRWILIHLLIGGLATLMVFLGIWQLQRLDDRRARNAEIELNTTQDIATATQDFGTSTDEWRRVVLTGNYVAGSDISVINRSQDGVAGDNVAAVFETETNGFFLVNRGFVPLSVTKQPAPKDSISLVGYVRMNQTRRNVGAIDSSTKGTTEFQRYDLERIKSALDVDINTNFYVQLIKESPSTNAQWPSPVPFPAVDEGPHFSYAMQWFFFSFVALAGWIVVIVRKVRSSNDPALEQTSA